MLTATEDEFLRFVPYDTIAGFAQPLERGAAIVMPVEAAESDDAAIIRHEFGHTLLFNPWFDYPHWYEEGFAELISTIEFDRRHEHFTIGKRPERYRGRLRPRIDWPTLVRPDFNPHALSDRRMIRSAYAQNWLLVHYLSLNNDPQHVFELERYFARVTANRDSPTAFAEAFGIEPAVLWDETLNRYYRRPPILEYTFNTDKVDLEFSRAPEESGFVSRLRRFLIDKADARRPGEHADLELLAINGHWDQLKVSDQCSDPFRFSVEADTGMLLVDGFYSGSGGPSTPAVFAPETVATGRFRLVDVTSERFPHIPFATDYELTFRSDSVICFDRQPATVACQGILHRCSAD